MPWTQRTTGAFYELLKRNSFEEAVLVVQKSALAAQLLLEAEYKPILQECKPLVQDVEARNKVKRCSLVPVPVVVAACAAYGRCPQTTALLSALRQLPRVWQLQQEQEANHARLEHDYALEMELEELEEEEELSPLLVQLLSTLRGGEGGRSVSKHFISPLSSHSTS